jgi:hypothetical protein
VGLRRIELVFLFKKRKPGKLGSMAKGKERKGRRREN